MNLKAQNHFSFDTIERYLAGEVGEEEAFLIDVHMGECNECAERVRLVRRLNFLFNQWTAKEHGKTYLMYRLLTALKQAEQTVPEPLKERLRRWLKVFAGRAEAALRITMNAPKGVSQIVIEGVEAITKPQPRWQFSYSLASVRVRRTARGMQRAPLVEKTVVKAEGTPSIEVSLKEIANEVCVTFSALPPEQPVPLVLLIPDAEEGSPLIVEGEREPETNCCVVRFQNVPAGRYTLVFEPMGE